jgi:hypothetical protein
MGAGETISSMPKWSLLIARWFAHCRHLSNWWWAVIAGVWSAFSVADTAISHWGSDSLKLGWKNATLHFPFGWQVWAIGLLLLVVFFVYHGSYLHAKELNRAIAALRWPDDRPVLLFDSWGEVPHDHPEARFHEISEYQKERQYWERGFFLTNQGGTAHEVCLMPVQLAENVYVISPTPAPRIDRGAKGFVFAYMDTEHNTKFGEDFERWDLLKVMAALEKKINSARVGEYPLTIQIGVVYRDFRGIWFASTAEMTYRKELNRIVFGSTEQAQGSLREDSIVGLLTRP